MTLTGKIKMKDLMAKWKNCTACSLHKTRNKIVLGKGSKSPIICFIGIGPGKEEDKKGQPFVGPAGQLLHKIIDQYAIPVEDCSFLNVVCCRPFIEADGRRKDRDPTWEEIDACKERLNEFLTKLNPALIVALGKVAGTVLLGLPEETKITDLHGNIFPCNKTALSKVPCILTYHPSYILRKMPKEEEMSENNLLKVMMEAHTDWLTINWIYSKSKRIRELLGSN